ncbi:LOW QUALITY PROTEIN: Trk-type K+ transport system, membrane component, partial [Geosmithia morbida]
ISLTGISRVGREEDQTDAWITFCALLSFPILYAGGNLSAVNAIHFGTSAATESGLNTVDLANLPTYQQAYLYIIPCITNLGVINIVVVVVRLWWFRKHLKRLGRRASDPDPPSSRHALTPRKAPALYEAKRGGASRDVDPRAVDVEDAHHVRPLSSSAADRRGQVVDAGTREPVDDGDSMDVAPPVEKKDDGPVQHIKFDPSADNHPKNDEGALYIPGPRDRDQGRPFVELHGKLSTSDDNDRDETPGSNQHDTLRRRRVPQNYGDTVTLDRVATVASSVFVVGPDVRRVVSRSRSQQQQQQQQPQLNSMPILSNQATVGRNSQFRNLTSEDREALGGIEYRSLKLLLKIIVGTSARPLLTTGSGWQNAARGRFGGEFGLAGCRKDETAGEGSHARGHRAFYTSQTMVNNLGLTLTPDSMITFRDAEWPMFVMSFLAFAGNTFYPVFLRLIIWVAYKAWPTSSPSGKDARDSLRFLLDHPRRCYTLLFPGKHTWALFVILFMLNFIDALLIIVLDLHNPEVASLPLGPRVLAAIFQSASSRHTGTASFALANVNPAVQFSLLVMMYISVFPIAMSIRASNTYEERSLGVYGPAEVNPDDDGSQQQRSGAAYLLSHMQNQLSFDLWYIFLGIFCIAISEADRIMDDEEPVSGHPSTLSILPQTEYVLLNLTRGVSQAINLFSIFFECTSAYGNVGLSLGYPGVNFSLCGKFKTFSKLVLCAIMIRGRHRGLPYELDRAIMLPDEHLIADRSTTRDTAAAADQDE